MCVFFVVSFVVPFVFFCFFFFFFSSRRRHTRLVSDWSSDVCSSDLLNRTGIRCGWLIQRECWKVHACWMPLLTTYQQMRPSRSLRIMSSWFCLPARSEERRVGKECRSRWSAEH